MIRLEIFNDRQVMSVNRIVCLAEDIVSEHYKMSQTQWLRNRYDVSTLAHLDESEIVYGPYAQIVRYSGRKKDTELGSEAFDFYRICLQDHSILKALRENEGLFLEPFILYIVTHELIHIVRFGQFIQFFDANESQRTEEEKLVHRCTVEILKKSSMDGLDFVFSFNRHNCY